MIKTKADLAKLTHRQREVLTLLARQLSNNEVVRLLHIAEQQRISTRKHFFRRTPPFKRELSPTTRVREH